ncbi:MAG: TetR/AcrR family transcriptional regulator [Burkholderiales bacterium]|nr:TetR/AcrR family transcriptional regulator [Burkholderiales bacterium]
MPASSPPNRSPRRTRAEQAEFYEHLVQTALQLFSDGGFEAVSMRRLAGEVGVPPMTLYRYFPSKLHLVRHVWDHILARACERASQDLADLKEPLARLRGYLDGFLQYWLEHREHYWIVFAFQDDLGEPQAGETAAALAPDLRGFFTTLGQLLDACAASPLDATRRRHELDLMVCKALGFLLGAIGLASLRWTDASLLKAGVLDDIVGRLQPANAAPA